MGLGCAKRCDGGAGAAAMRLGRHSTEKVPRGWWRLCLDCCHERLDTDDVHDAREIVSQYMQGHLGGHARQRFHQEVRRTHPHLERAEGMLGRLAAHAHCLRISTETLLHRFKQVLMFPSRDAPLRTRRTSRFERAAWTCGRPIAA